jgi:signal transduction histidine kinase
MGSLLGGLWGGILFATLSSIFFLSVPNHLFLSKVDFLFEIVLFYFFGSITGFLVNKEKRKREKLKEAQHLALAGKAAAAIAHELRTPLVVIGGFSRIIQRQFPPKSSFWKKLDIVLKEAKWMEEIIQGILDFSKPLRLQLRPTDIKSLVEEAVNLVAPEKEAKIQVRFATLVSEIKLDPDRFKQVLINLLNNAIQAAPNRSVKINVFFAKGSMIIEIMDKGPGIPKEYQNEILEPFFSTKARGTGLGLAIVKKIIDAHHGKISFRTYPEKGTTFIVTIPTNL